MFIDGLVDKEWSIYKQLNIICLYEGYPALYDDMARSLTHCVKFYPLTDLRI